MATSEGTDCSRFQHFHRDFKLVVNYLEAHKELMDAHMVDFFTCNHWKTLLSQQIREDLESLSREQLTSLPTCTVACDLESKEYKTLGEHLKMFLAEAGQAQLKSFTWVKDQDEFTSESKVNFISHIMTPKKSYEVDIMADVISGMAKRFQVLKILDLGSGKGYLSQCLALQYGLKVVGVDSSNDNTQYAARRNERLLKVWAGLVRKSQRDDANSSSSFPEKNITCTSRHFESQSLGTVPLAQRRKENNSESLSNTCTTCCNGTVNVCGHCDEDTNRQVDSQGCLYKCYLIQRTLKADNPPDTASDIGVMETNYCTTKHAADFLAPISHESPSSSLSFNSPQCDNVVHSKGSSDKNKLPHSRHTCLCTGNAQILKSQESHRHANTANPTSFVPVTRFVDQSFVANGDLTRLFDELESSSDKVNTACNGVFIVGLHTCGDLAPTALRIFANEPSVKLICIVGCCYHLVTQEIGGADDTGAVPGFPMSEFLKPFRLHISRNATMVAQQAAEKMATESKCPPPSVLYRAILQVILKEKFGLDGRGMHVGKAGAKCKDFKEYVHKCLNKLGLKDRISELSDEEVNSYLTRFKDQERHLHAFHQLRAAIAPCIESVFLLDRLCYLYEQGHKSACIVRLFDPVRSPRCYAIIASKT